MIYFDVSAYLRKFVWMKRLAIVIVCLLALVSVACRRGGNAEVDRLNELAYGYRYRNLDSTVAVARRAYDASMDYDRGRAEALNNMAFVSIARMNYAEADSLLVEAVDASDDEIECAIADIQMMRVCQRQSRNKDFYMYRYSAQDYLDMAKGRRALYDEHQQSRLDYAQSEMAIVESAYYYYVGLESASRKAIEKIDPGSTIARDTAQLLCYYYYMGSGGLINDSTPTAVAQREFDMLLRCYLLSRQMNFPYWEANAMQGIAEHLLNDDTRKRLAADNPKEIDFINTDNIALDSLPANLARRSLTAFMDYGDTYQTAGAYRTLAQCLWQTDRYSEALSTLQQAVESDTAVYQAPDLIASISEQFSMVYSALDNKPESDRYRNTYLDLQEQTRQDRQLEARAEQLGESTQQLNIIIAIGVVAVVIVAAVLLIYAFRQWRRLRQTTRDRLDDLHEQSIRASQECLNNKQRNLEQRAKVALVEQIMPLISRIIHELDCLVSRSETDTVRQERKEYVAELAEKINEYNAVLTDWIQIRQGRLRLRIETFPLSTLFNIVSKNASVIERAGVRLNVSDTDLSVKADRTLTLFMINTMIDNARRFTHQGDTINVTATDCHDSVELAVSDTGDGMTDEKLQSLFNPNTPHRNTSEHGFGLLNCRGIIEHYRKTSQLFSVCRIEAESSLGKGTTIKFRLPKGIKQTLAIIAALLMPQILLNAAPITPEQQVAAYADSTISCNIRGQYQTALQYADSCIFQLNNIYFSTHPQGTDVMTVSDVSSTDAAELQWWRDSVAIDFQSILIVRNEMAVAALALHNWDLYQYNNKVYTQLFRMVSADRTLEHYVSGLKKIEHRRNLTVVLLSIVLFLVCPLCYFLFYRRQKNYLKHAQQQIEEAAESLRTKELQRDKYYINNSVMDNCLSTLKHETMFYPSKLCTMIADEQTNDDDLLSVANYYKELFSWLSQMAQEQTLSSRTIDTDMFDYILQLIATLGGTVDSNNIGSQANGYQSLLIPFPQTTYNATVAANLFAPTTIDVRFIMIRQWLREIGETLGARACGVTTTQHNGQLAIVITLTQKLMQQLLNKQC